MSASGVCSPVSDQCATWNSVNGNCLSCYGGYLLQSGACVVNPSPFNGGSNPLCSTWAGTQCIKCSTRCFFDAAGICTSVSDQCQTYDPSNGYCFTCYAGYSLANGVCTASPTSIPSDVGCSTWNAAQSVCLACSHRFYFNGAQCMPVSDQCQIWDVTGQCTACYSGYDLINGACQVSTSNTKPSDLGCGTWNWNQQICLACSNNWVFNNNGVCVPVSDQCQTYDLAGNCVSCYKGYNLSARKCVLAPIETVTDAGCGTWDWSNKICMACSNNFVFNNNGVCVAVSDQCQTFDRSGSCVSCYKGYTLVSGTCQQSAIEKPSDLGCGTWDWNNKICLACSNNWVFSNNGVCVPVSDQCQTYDLAGNCVSCYKGYNLSVGQCVLAPIEKVTDLGCGLWNWNSQICLKCSNNWVFSNNGVCVPVSDQCKTFDLAGSCVSCYKGYNLSVGKCVLAPTTAPSDSGCALWNWNSQTCLKCSNNWVFNNKGVCVVVSDQCKTFDLAGNCQSCYVGYNLSVGKCVLAPTQVVSDLGCGTWDWKQQICLACSNNWVFNNKGVCVVVSDQCQTFDLAGNCVSCYKGYNLSVGKCVLAPIEKVTDLGCATWDWNNKICLACSNRYVFSSSGVCTPVNDNCQQWNTAGSCTSCFAGYVLNGGSCTQGNSLCETSSSAGACTTCYTGYLLDNGSCVAISKLASLALFYSQCCPEKLATLTTELGGTAGGHIQFHA